MAGNPSANPSRPLPDQGAAQQTPTGSPAWVWLLGLLFTLGLIWTLRATVSVTLPLAIAVIVAISVWPVSGWVQARVPKRLRWLGNLAALALVMLILALLAGGLVLAARQVLGEIPQASGPLREQAMKLAGKSGLTELLGGSQQVVDALDRGMETIASYATGLLSAVTSLATGLVLVLFLVLLMLAEAGTWRGKLASISGGQDRWGDTITAIGQRFRHYFLTRTLLGLLTGALYAGYLALFGVPLLLVWGLLAFLLNFVPTVGSIVAGILPVLYAAVTQDTTTALMVAGGIFVIEQVIGNYVDPKVLGRQLAISPLIILVALLLWTWIWGMTGALVAVPMTVLLIVVFAQVPALRPVALLLSDERDIKAVRSRTRPE